MVTSIKGVFYSLKFQDPNLIIYFIEVILFLVKSYLLKIMRLV